MAELGMSKVDGINEVLRGAGYATITSAPATNATDDSGQARDVLDRIKQKILTKGWKENSEVGKAYTPAGAGGAAGSSSVSTAFTDGTWTQSSHTLTKSSAFAAYDINTSDEIYIYSDQGDALIKEGYYGVATDVGANAITLDHDPAIANNSRIAARALGDLKITVGSDVLMIRSSGNSPNGYRSLVLQADDVVYDADRGTDKFEYDTEIYLDVTRDYNFEDVAPNMKELIVAWARLEFQRYRKGLGERDAFLLQELELAEAEWPRNSPDPAQDIQSFNAFSSLFATLQRQASQRQADSRR
jgi:hypothetical protein